MSPAPGCSRAWATTAAAARRGETPLSSGAGWATTAPKRRCDDSRAQSGGDRPGAVPLGVRRQGEVDRGAAEGHRGCEDLPPAAARGEGAGPGEEGGRGGPSVGSVLG